MRARTSLIAVMLLTVGCGDPDGRPGGGWETPAREGMTLGDLACNRNGDCPEDGGETAPPPEPSPAPSDVDDDVFEEPGAPSAANDSLGHGEGQDADDLDHERGPHDAPAEDEDEDEAEAEIPEETPFDAAPNQPEEGHEANGPSEPSPSSDSTPGEPPAPGSKGAAEDQADEDDASEDAAPEADDPTDRDEGEDAADRPAAAEDAPPQGESDAAPRQERSEGRAEDCPERCDFNADCPSDRPLCVYGRCFAEDDVPFDP